MHQYTLVDTRNTFCGLDMRHHLSPLQYHVCRKVTFLSGCLSPSMWCWYFHLIFYCYGGLGYIVAFTKVPTTHQVYHTWIHPLHHSPLFPSPIPAIVSTGLLFLFTYTYTVFTLIHPYTPFPYFFLPLTGTNNPRQDLSCPPVLWFCKKKKKDIFVCLR
jgi:hypothetical protein